MIEFLARLLTAKSYLGAAPLIQDKGILSTAASIATIEARHQTFIRVAGSKEPIPAAFDTPLGPRAAFTLAAPFIQSCPEGSNLPIVPFPSLSIVNSTEAEAGSSIEIHNDGHVAEAKFCSFMIEYVAMLLKMFAHLRPPSHTCASFVVRDYANLIHCIDRGQTTFVPFEHLTCEIPSFAAGEIYVLLTTKESTCDADVVAG